MTKEELEAMQAEVEGVDQLVCVPCGERIWQYICTAGGSAGLAGKAIQCGWAIVGAEVRCPKCKGNK